MPAGRPSGTTETPQSILKAELKKNRGLMDEARKRLELVLPTISDPELLAKVIDVLSRANAGTMKIIEAAEKSQAVAEDAPLSEEMLAEFVKTGRVG